MQRAFQKIALATLLLAGSAFAAESNLLSMATDGAISKATADTMSLNDKEMKDVVGGYQYIGGWTTIQNGSMVQTLGRSGWSYNGRTIYVVAEKYGATMSSGYSIYLTFDTPSVTVNTMQGTKYSYAQIPTNTAAWYNVLAVNLAGAKNQIASMSLRR